MPHLNPPLPRVLTFVVALLLATATSLAEEQLEPIAYNNPGLKADLGVGLWAWPLPMDYDGDGDLDLVVSCPDKPYNGTYLFENPGGGAFPTFKPARRIGRAVRNIQISYTDDGFRLLDPAGEYVDFRNNGWDKRTKLPLPVKIDSRFKRYRANQWKSVDFDGDGDQDLIIGLGVWDDYGWDDAWNDRGEWVNGPLHGLIYFVENTGSDESPKYAPARPLTAGDDDAQVDVYGMPSPNLADFDGDGDLDLLCGEFLDGFTYFENVGSRTEPKYAAGRRLTRNDGDGGRPAIRMDLQMITPVALDWDGDGDVDLICGDEDGRVALIEHLGRVEDGMPQFASPRYFQQQAENVKFGALVTPVSVDWDGDGDEDLICGNTAGYIGLIENLGGNPPKWDRPRYLVADISGLPIPFRDVIRHEAGPTGSIQGPCEAKWGYTAPTVADWNHDGRDDIIVNGIWGKVVWYPRKADGGLGPAQPIRVNWDGHPPKPSWTWWEPEEGTLATQWRTTPGVVDWNGDGLNDLVMLDTEGYLAFYERKRDGEELVLLPPKRIFHGEGPCEFDSRGRAVGKAKDGLLRLNTKSAGGSGRRKFCFVDWDLDGDLDLLVNSVNVNLLRNVRTDKDGNTWFRDEGPLDERVLAGHTTSPTVVDWDGNGVPDLLVGGEDGFLYYKRHPRADELAAAKSDQ
ncbi:MAG: FG-GAP repeat domain-containing protein [Maioricimonas sp. JB045]